VLTIFICAHQRPSTAIGKKPLPADALLRESLYLLQGISGVHISFATAPAAQPNPYLLPPHHFPSAGPATGASPHLSSASFEGDGPIDEIEEAGQLIFRESTEGGTVSGPVRGLLRGLGETGWLVRNVETFVREVQDAASTGGGAGDMALGNDHVRRGGLVEQVRYISRSITSLGRANLDSTLLPRPPLPTQSLCHFLQTQLTEYYHLISILETQMSSSNGDDADDGGVDGFEPGEGLTLMRLGVWTREARLKMRLMSLMVDDCRCASIRLAPLPVRPPLLTRSSI
jgi:gamma-tubulin complex component 3